MRGSKIGPKLRNKKRNESNFVRVTLTNQSRFRFSTKYNLKVSRRIVYVKRKINASLLHLTGRKIETKSLRNVRNSVENRRDTQLLAANNLNEIFREILRRTEYRHHLLTDATDYLSTLACRINFSFRHSTVRLVCTENTECFSGRRTKVTCTRCTRLSELSRVILRATMPKTRYVAPRSFRLHVLSSLHAPTVVSRRETARTRVENVK